MNKAFQFHEYTASSMQDPDVAAYGHAGWELVAVLPADEWYTFFLQREYVPKSEISPELREFNIQPKALFIQSLDQTVIPNEWIKVREVIE